MIRYMYAVQLRALEGGITCTGLVVSRIYDSNTVHYLSMLCEELKWKVNEDYFFNMEMGNKVLKDENNP